MLPPFLKRAVDDYIKDAFTPAAPSAMPGAAGAPMDAGAAPPAGAPTDAGMAPPAGAPMDAGAAPPAGAAPMDITGMLGGGAGGGEDLLGDLFGGLSPVPEGETTEAVEEPKTEEKKEKEEQVDLDTVQRDLKLIKKMLVHLSSSLGVGLPEDILED